MRLRQKLTTCLSLISLLPEKQYYDCCNYNWIIVYYNLYNLQLIIVVDLFVGEIQKTTTGRYIESSTITCSLIDSAKQISYY